MSKAGRMASLPPCPQRSSLLATPWKFIGPSHSYRMRGFLPAAAATRARQPRWSAGGQNPGRGGLALGLSLLHDLERGANTRSSRSCGQGAARLLPAMKRVDVCRTLPTKDYQLLGWIFSELPQDGNRLLRTPNHACPVQDPDPRLHQLIRRCSGRSRSWNP